MNRSDFLKAAPAAVGMTVVGPQDVPDDAIADVRAALVRCMAELNDVILKRYTVEDGRGGRKLRMLRIAGGNEVVEVEAGIPLVSVIPPSLPDEMTMSGLDGNGNEFSVTAKFRPRLPDA